MEHWKLMRQIDGWVRSAAALIGDWTGAIGQRRDDLSRSCGCSRADLLVVPDVIAYST